MNSVTETVVPDTHQGKRLDQALELFMPDIGLRGRKRIWEHYLVEVDGRPRNKGFRVSRGQRIALIPRKDRAGGPTFALNEWPGVRIVKRQGGFAALNKPSGLHTARIENRFEPSLEEGIGVLIPDQQPRLMNRLDQSTSGLVLAALDPVSAEYYLKSQSAGRVLKFYLAVCRGRLEGELEVDRFIVSSGRKKVRVCEKRDHDPLRRTRIRPLAYDPRLDRTLVEALIFRGARHQIRAHLSWLGFPLCGDPLYGQESASELQLHHYRITFPGFEAEIEPEWDILHQGGIWTFK